MQMLELVIKKIFGYCPSHGWFKYPKKFRTLASRAHHEKHFCIGCKECKEESDQYFIEANEEYEKTVLQ